MEPGQQNRYRGYPSHGDAQMPSFSGILSVNLQYHLDQGNLKHRKVVKINNKCHMYTTYVIIQIEISMLRKISMGSHWQGLLTNVLRSKRATFLKFFQSESR